MHNFAINAACIRDQDYAQTEGKKYITRRSDKQKVTEAFNRQNNEKEDISK